MWQRICCLFDQLTFLIRLKFFTSLWRTADPDADFLNLQDSIVFNPGVDTMSFVVTPVDDGITEPQEYLEYLRLLYYRLW